MPERSGCVVTVGTYDGVHLGHRRLLAESLAEGRRRGLPTVVVTFDHHPLEVLRPDLAPRLLTGLDHKLELLREAGPFEIALLHFDMARAAESAEDFVLSYLFEELGAAAVLVGSNFRFGHRQRGDIAMLEELARANGRSAHGIDLVIDDETRTVVSSSVIRDHLTLGEVHEAARLLGRPHEVRGRVAAGELVLDPMLVLPAPGAYAVRLGRRGGTLGESRVEIEGVGGELRVDADTASLNGLEGAEFRLLFDGRLSGAAEAGAEAAASGESGS